MKRATILLAFLVCGCGNVDDRPAAWGYISPAIFQPACATSSCHSRQVAVGGVDLSDPDRGYASLTAGWFVDPKGTAADGCQPWGDTMVCPSRPLVVAYDPGESRLVSMLRGRGAARMPPDRPLPEPDIRLVENWILDGARKTIDGPPATTAHDAGPTEDGAVDGGAVDGTGSDDGTGSNDGGGQ